MQEFEQALGDGKGQGSLVGYHLWGHKELDMTEWLNKYIIFIPIDIIVSAKWVLTHERFKKHSERMLAVKSEQWMVIG